MHEVATNLLFSLEGMADLQWHKLLQMQNKDGSFLFSPSSTAYALMQTGDVNCLCYLKSYELNWRYWSEKGICWTSNSNVQSVDETAMAFRLLRIHGYRVSPDVFHHFEKDGEFFCFVGQSSQAVTVMYNLNRASWLMFPGEKILEQAKNFSCKFLKEKQAAKQLVDKWVIMKDLPGEVGYGLDFPFHASLPCVESRWYVEQYGGSDDVWIGKALYRMPYVNNNTYLELARADFNQCQAVHQLEWLDLQRWGKEHALEVHGVTRRSMLKAYFLAAASIFEPDRSAERLGWAQTAVLADAVAYYFHSDSCTDETRQLFLQDFFMSCQSLKLIQPDISRPKGLVGSILGLVDFLSANIEHRRQSPPQLFRQLLIRAWEEWISTWTREEENKVLLLVRTVELCAGRVETEDEPARKEYSSLVQLTTSVCRRLRVMEEKKESRSEKDYMVEEEMQELTKCVLENNANIIGLNIQTKQNFLTIAKSFYYTAHCSTATINKHITKVLFEPVE